MQCPCTELIEMNCGIAFWARLGYVKRLKGIKDRVYLYSSDVLDVFSLEISNSCVICLLGAWWTTGIGISIKLTSCDFTVLAKISRAAEVLCKPTYAMRTQVIPSNVVKTPFYSLSIYIYSICLQGFQICQQL